MVTGFAHSPAEPWRVVCGTAARLRTLSQVAIEPDGLQITETSRDRVGVAEASAGEAPGVELPTVISAEAISRRVAELGAEISAAYEGREPVLVLVLHGAFIFGADLTRVLSTAHRVESLALTSYDGRESRGEVQVVKDLGCDIGGRDVLIVEDIVDTGRTAAAALELLEARRPRSIEVVTLLDKPSRRVTDVKPRWVGFEIENIFVVGYGLDLEGRFRGLPYIADADAMDLKGDA